MYNDGRRCNDNRLVQDNRLWVQDTDLTHLMLPVCPLHMPQAAIFRAIENCRRYARTKFFRCFRWGQSNFGPTGRIGSRGQLAGGVPWGCSKALRRGTKYHFPNGPCCISNSFCVRTSFVSGGGEIGNRVNFWCLMPPKFSQPQNCLIAFLTLPPRVVCAYIVMVYTVRTFQVDEGG